MPRLMRLISKDLDPSNALPVVESKKSTTGRHASSSLDAYEEGIWHEKMNKNGIYRPRGNVMNGEDGVSWWQEDTNGHWRKYFSISIIIPDNLLT